MAAVSALISSSLSVSPSLSFTLSLFHSFILSLSLSLFPFSYKITSCTHATDEIVRLKTDTVLC